MDHFVLELFTGGHSVGIYSTLDKAKDAYREHCKELEVDPSAWVHHFHNVWYAPDDRDKLITNISITRITLDAPMPFV